MIVFMTGFLAAHIDWPKFFKDHLFNFEKFEHSVSTINRLIVDIVMVCSVLY